MMTRREIEALATKLRIAAASCGDWDEFEVAELMKTAADIVDRPSLFSSFQLNIAAGAMGLLHIANADIWVLRQRLTEFFHSTEVFTPTAFAHYLEKFPRGGVQ